MRSELDRLEIIQQYLDGELKGDVKDDFEEELKSNDTLREELAQQKILNEAVLIQGLIDLEQEVKDYNYPKLKSRLGKKWLYYSGLGAIFLSIFFFLDLNEEKEKGAMRLEQSVSRDYKSDFGQIEEVESLHEEVQHNVNNEPVDLESYDFVKPRQVEVIPVIEDQETQRQQLVVEAIQSKTDRQEISDEVVDLCMGVEIKSDFVSGRTCLGLDEGSLVIGSIEGGKSPYTVLIDQREPTSQRSFSDLNGGSHRYLIRDKNGCLSNVVVFDVETYSCAGSSEDSFAPDEGQEFVFPIHEDFNGRVEIRDKEERLVFESEIIYGSPNTWDGQVESGVYFYRIMSENENLVEQGSVSVIR